MSLMRGEVYCWQDAKRWYVWSDAPNGHPEMSGWAQGKKNPFGIGLTEAQMDELVAAWLKRREERATWA